MLLEVAFVQTPQFNGRSFCQMAQFFSAATLSGSDWTTWGRGLRNRNPILSEHPLALAESQIDAVVLPLVFGQQWTVPQRGIQAEATRCGLPSFLVQKQTLRNAVNYSVRRRF